jgi:hypothetical protein
MGTERCCWECARRQLVCDGAASACNRCKISRIVCPGYEDAKPLLWLAPGKVKSRNWAKKPPKAKGERARDRKQLPVKVAPRNVDLSMPGTEAHAMSLVPEIRLTSLFGPDSLQRTEGSDLYQAVVYCELSVLSCRQDVSADLPYVDNRNVCSQYSSHALGPSPFNMPIGGLVLLDDALKSVLVSMMLRHRIHSIAKHSKPQALSTLWDRFLHYRGLTIRCLVGQIGDDYARSTDLTILASILFLYTEVRQIDLDGYVSALTQNARSFSNRHHRHGGTISAVS